MTPPPQAERVRLDTPAGRGLSPIQNELGLLESDCWLAPTRNGCGLDLGRTDSSPIRNEPGHTGMHQSPWCVGVKNRNTGRI